MENKTMIEIIRCSELSELSMISAANGFIYHKKKLFNWMLCWELSDMDSSSLKDLECCMRVWDVLTAKVGDRGLTYDLQYAP